jgi:hypothetical protein
MSHGRTPIAPRHVASIADLAGRFGSRRWYRYPNLNTE